MADYLSEIKFGNSTSHEACQAATVLCVYEAVGGLTTV